jgi:hypothetical protein
MTNGTIRESRHIPRFYQPRKMNNRDIRLKMNIRRKVSIHSRGSDVINKWKSGSNRIFASGTRA